MAKIFGQLEVAQFENAATDPLTALAPGRVWANIATSTKAVPKFYDGSNTFELVKTALYANGSVTGNVTIDWSLGLTQSCILGGQTIVSFTNPPASGQELTLVVGQYTSGYYRISFPNVVYWGQANATPDLIPASAGTVYKFRYDGSNWFAAVTSLGGYYNPPITLGSILHCAYSPDGNWLAVAYSTKVYVYPVRAGAFGVEYGAPFTSGAAAGTILCLAWHPSTGYISVGSATTPYLQTWPFSNAGFGTVLSNPGSLPAGTVTGVAYSTSGDAVVYSSTTTPFVGGYPFLSGLYGTKYTAPGTTPTSAHSIAVHPNQVLVALGLDAAPGITVLAFNSLTGWGATSSAPTPATLLASQVPDAVDFSPDGQYVALGSTASPYITVWPISATGVFGTVFSNPSTLPTGQIYGVNFSPQSDFVCGMAQASSVYLYAYPWSSAGFGTLGTNASTAPGATSIGITWHPSGRYGTWYGPTSPYFGTYNMVRAAKTYTGTRQ